MILVYRSQLENPQYPFALRWRADGSFIFQSQSALESMALEQLGFADRLTFFVCSDPFRSRLTLVDAEC